MVLPGLGALIASRRNAHIDSDRGVIVPPARTLSFNSLITYDDGLLTTSVMRREHIGYNAAGVIVSRHIEEMRRHLSDEQGLTIDRVGRFTAGADDAIEFTPADDIASNDSYALLSDVMLPLTDEEQQVRDEQAAREVRRADSNTIYLPLSRNVFKIAASLLMIVSLGWLSFSTLRISDEPTRASFAPAAAPVAEPVAEEIFVDEDNQTDDDIADAVDEPVSTIRNMDSDPYCLVIASLASQAEVDRYLELTDETVPLGVSHKGGRYRVYIATGESLEDAMAQRANDGVAERYPDAWATRR